MRIAIPVDGETVCRQYSDAAWFTLYDLADDTKALSAVGRRPVKNPGCTTTPAQLREHGVELVIASEISQNGVNGLLEYGILTLKDVPVQKPDAIIAQLVSGTLACTVCDPAIHRANAGGCGNGGCAHCTAGH